MAALLWYLTILLPGMAAPAPTPPAIAYDASATCTTICLNDCPRAFVAVNSSPAFNTDYRSTVEIVWSCLAVIFACTWLCVHPHVAGYNTTMSQRLWKRLKLFGLATFAPELLAVIAFFQWKGCRELHKDFKSRAEQLNIPLDLNPGDGNRSGGDEHPCVGDDRRAEGCRRASQIRQGVTRKVPEETAWTLTHAHFIQMGGVVFRNPENGDIGFADPSQWEDEHIKSFFSLRLSEAEISDKSKGSALAKTLVVMQVLWFVAQTIARAIERLPITHLEVVCLAFTAFNVGMYVCRWDKPLDVECPLTLPGKPAEGSKSLRATHSWLEATLHTVFDLPVGPWRYLESERKFYPSLYCYHGKTKERSFLDACFSLAEGGLGGDFTFALAFTASSFGAIHAIGWSLPFPTLAEQQLWRASCLTLVFYPFSPLVTLWSANRLQDGPRAIKMILWPIGLLCSLLSHILYAGARFTFLVLPLLELRDIPHLSHQTVSWSNLLPHI